MDRQVEKQADKIYKAIVCKIKSELLKRQVSYNRLAELAGVSSSCICEIFNLNKTMNSGTLIKLAIALGITQDIFNNKYTNKQIIDKEIEIRQKLVEVKQQEIIQLQKEIIDLTR